MRFEKLRDAVKVSFEGRNLLITLPGAILAYLLLVIFTFPAYAYQLLAKNVFYFPEVVKMSTLSVFDTSGLTGVVLTVLYAAMTGILLTNVYIGIRSSSFSGILDFGAFLPGFLVSGCASCGFGLLTLMGFSGALALLPFSGNLVMLAGILLIALLLQRTGDPRKCSI